MPKNIFLPILFLLIISTFVNAATQFPNGSFETGTLSDWNVTFDQNNQPLGGCTTAGNTGTSTVTTNWASDGSYSWQLFDNDAGNVTCGRITNTLQTFTGFYRFYVDINSYQTNGNCTTGTACKFSFLKNNQVQKVYPGTNDCSYTPSIQAGDPSIKETYSCDFNGTDFNFRSAFQTGSVGNILRQQFDNFRYEQVPQLQHNVVEEGDPFPVDTNFSITDALFLDTNLMIVSDATCTITFDGVNASFPFNSSIQKYEYTYSTSVPKTVNYNIGCTHAGTSPSGAPAYYPTDGNVTGTVTFVVDLSTGNKLTVTDISNVSHTINSTKVTFDPTNESNEIIFSIKNNYTTGLSVPQFIFNALKDGRQYFVYTASQTEYNQNVFVFNDTLTFGVSENDAIQKIWDDTNQLYSYSYSDNIGVGETKYYKLTYRNPYKSYDSIRYSTDWYNVFEPQASNSQSINTDVFQVSAYSNIRSIFIQNVPDIVANGFQVGAFELQFTAWADQNNVTISGGQTIYDTDSVVSATLSTTPHRFSFTINASSFNSQILFKSSETSPHTIYIQDYSIVPRYYFTKRLTLAKSNGDPLDLFLLNSHSKKYIQEGSPFKVKSEYYDREGNVRQFKIESFFDLTADDVNKVSYSFTDFNNPIEFLYDFDQPFDGIIDLNGNAVFPTTPRDLTLKATIYDDANNAIAQQSQSVKFIQFPYFGGDFFLQFFPTEKRKGKNPEGILQIETSNIDSLEGLDIRIYDQNSSITSPDYQKRIYKGSDFTCVTGSCSFNIKIDDFLYEDANLAHFVVTGLMNTEYFSLTNPLVQVDRTIFLSQISFDAAKIYQVLERTNTDVHLANRYKNTEEIPLFLALRSGDKENLKNEILVYLTLENCNTDGNFLGTGNCVSQTNKWYPTGYLYDDKFGFNVYYFRNIFLLDNGQLLPDGNYIGFHAHVTDPKGTINPIVPVLAPRCNNQGIIDLLFFPGAGLSALSNLLGFTNGCQFGQQSDVVTTTLNSNQEIRIHIVNSYSPVAPAFPSQICLAPDTNNIVADSLKQDLICLVSYTVSEKPIDNFRFRLGNQYSDYSVTGANKQYVEFNLPFELVAFNDPLLLKAELESKGSTITTVGDFYYELFKDYTINSANFYGIPDKVDFLLGNGLIPNIGGDINTAALNQAFSATSVSGLMLIDIKGVPIVNAQDFKSNSKVSPVFDAIDRKKFLSYLDSKGVPYKTLVPPIMKVVVSDILLPVTLSDPQGAIVIDQVPTKENINTSNLDTNQTTPYGNKVPASIILTLTSTMFYDNFSSSFILSNIIKIYAFFFQNISNFLSGIVDALVNPNPNSNPVSDAVGFLYSNILFIIVALGFLYTAVVIRDRFYGNRGR